MDLQRIKKLARHLMVSGETRTMIEELIQEVERLSPEHTEMSFQGAIDHDHAIREATAKRCAHLARCVPEVPMCYLGDCRESDCAYQRIRAEFGVE